MVTKIGINGFGRIGRLATRGINQYHRGELEVVAVNDLTDNETNAHLFKWDSSYGQYHGEVQATANGILVDGKEIKVLAEKDPANIKWQDLGVQIVIESTGLFTDAERWSKKSYYIRAGQKRRRHSGPGRQ
jgi:glyceraldehyde 3-phosphate dehydrogenase